MQEVYQRSQDEVKRNEAALEVSSERVSGGDTSNVRLQGNGPESTGSWARPAAGVRVT